MSVRAKRQSMPCVKRMMAILAATIRRRVSPITREQKRSQYMVQKRASRASGGMMVRL
jgi:hypothetical protein